MSIVFHIIKPYLCMYNKNRYFLPIFIYLFCEDGFTKLFYCAIISVVKVKILKIPNEVGNYK